MTKRVLVAALVTALVSLTYSGAVCAESDTGYAGLEFYGSSQVSKVELEKQLHLRPGADLEATLKAVDRLKEKLAGERIEANVNVASDEGRLYVAVDVMEPGSLGATTRKLVSPHHVYLSNDTPFNILDDLYARITKLADEGRTLTDTYPDGVKEFSDEPCNQYAKKLGRYVPSMRREFLTIIASDPDALRRRKAIDALNWDPHPIQNTYDVIPALADGSIDVRAKADTYIYPRIRLLPDNFPIQDLIEGFAQQLQRPSHLDRVEALKGLSLIVRTKPFAGGAVKIAAEDKLRQLQSQSVLTSIKQPCAQILDALAHLPPPPKAEKKTQLNEF